MPFVKVVLERSKSTHSWPVSHNAKKTDELVVCFPLLGLLVRRY